MSAKSDIDPLKRSQSAKVDGFISRVDAALAGRPRKWLSEKTGVSTSMLSDYGRGKTPGSDKAVAIADALGVDLNWLLTGRGAAPLTPGDPDEVEIDNIDFAYGMGGTFADIEEGSIEVEKAKFSRGWLRRFTHSPPEVLFTTSGVGDSMKPLIDDHDIVIIDRSVGLKDAMGDKVWAIVFGGVGMIKRLRPMPDGTVKIISANPDVPVEIATDGDLHVVGRVVAKVSRL